MPFCFLIQNFAEIGQSVDKLWPKNRFSSFNFWSRDCHRFNICCSLPNFTKIGRFLTEIWRFNDFHNGGCLPSCILKIGSFCHVALVDMPFCFLVQHFAEIGLLVDELWPKSDFQDGARRRLEFQKFQFLVTFNMTFKSGSI